MKKNIYFFTRLLIIVTPLCLAMEKDTIPTIHQAKILQTITAVKNPISTLYLQKNNEVIIIGVDKHVVYDTDTNKITTVLAEYEKEHVSTITNINLQKNKIAVIRDTYLKIYEIPQGNIVWQGNVPQFYNQPVFNSSDDMLTIVDHDLNFSAINYKQKNSRGIILNQQFTRQQIRFHSIVSHQNTTALTCISCQHIAKICNNAATPFYTFRNTKKRTYQSTCNNNGNVFVFNCCDNSVHVVNTALKTENILIKENDHITMVMKFLPNSDILATITTEEKKINFWNVRTQKLITTILLDNSYCESSWYRQGNSNYQELMNFSRDGTQLILTDLRQCYVIKTPLDAQYLPDTQKKCIFTFCFLNRINIPQDVIRYLMFNFLVAHKYSFTTY